MSEEVKRKGMNEQQRTEYLKKKTSVGLKEDPVSRIICDLTAEEFVESFVAAWKRLKRTS